jgi:hypothetical protein
MNSGSWPCKALNVIIIFLKSGLSVNKYTEMSDRKDSEDKKNSQNAISGDLGLKFPKFSRRIILTRKIFLNYGENQQSSTYFTNF